MGGTLKPTFKNFNIFFLLFNPMLLGNPKWGTPANSAEQDQMQHDTAS